MSVESWMLNRTILPLRYSNTTTGIRIYSKEEFMFLQSSFNNNQRTYSSQRHMPQWPLFVGPCSSTINYAIAYDLYTFLVFGIMIVHLRARIRSWTQLIAVAYHSPVCQIWHQANQIRWLLPMAFWCSTVSQTSSWMG